MVAAKNKTKNRKQLTRTIKKESAKEIGTINKRDRFMVGVSLYAGEGGKTDKDISFVNSNHKFIIFMMGWFREFCNVPLDKFRGSLYLHDNLSEEESKKYWSKLTKIPLNQFTKTYIVKNNQKRSRNIKHENGIFRIKISDANLHRKIMGWVDGTFK